MFTQILHPIKSTKRNAGYTPWLAMQLIDRLQLDRFLNAQLPPGREHIQCSLSALILIIARLLNPSSELHIAEQWYGKTALPELLGVPAERVDDNRLYRTLDALLLECPTRKHWKFT